MGDSKSEKESERNYYAKTEEKINNAKEKLKNLLEKFMQQPEKNTIQKKILRIKIKRLQNALRRKIAKFDIEFEADQRETLEYENFRAECDEIQEKLDNLRDEEDDLLFYLEYYTKRENFRAQNNSRLKETINKMAPKSQAGKERTIKNNARKPKTLETQERLNAVQAEIQNLEEMLNEKINDYQEYKDGIKGKTSQKITETMERLKEEESARNKQEKEELALANVSVWSSFKNAVKKAKNKFDQWRNNRKARKAEAVKNVDNKNIADATSLISEETASERFAASLAVPPEVVENTNKVGQEHNNNEKNNPAQPNKEDQKVPEGPAD